LANLNPSVPRYFFMILNSELKGQEKNISFEIIFLKLNFASVLQVLRKTLAQARCSIYFAKKKNAALTVAVCD
jgi:hypothetical protein